MKPILLSLLLFLAFDASSQCSSSTVRSGSTFSNNTSIGSKAWANPANAQSSDNVYSTSSFSLGVFSSDNTNYLVATGFNFSIPTAYTTICGIKVEVEKSFQTFFGVLSSVKDNSVKIVKGGIISGTDKASVTDWTKTDAYFSYGGPTDLWGLAWAPSDINSANFGVAISAKISSGFLALSMDARIDHIRVTIYYSSSLPVTFKDFYAEPMKDRIKLKWSTASESNSSYFVVEKADVNNGWKAMDTVPAAQNSISERNYESYDLAPATENVYRIKEVDFDGKVTYSKTVRLHFDRAEDPVVSVYPNPAKDLVYIETKSMIKDLVLYDISGRKIMHISRFNNQGSLQLPVGKSRPGVYFLDIETKDGRVNKKIIIQSDL